MKTNEKNTEGNWIDPDDAPRLPKGWFKTADLYEGKKLVRRGRPKLDNPKQQVSLRLDPDVIEGFRATGPGWQSRINDTLKKALEAAG